MWGMSIHNLYKGDVLFFSSAYIWKGVLDFKLKVDVQKGAPKV